jgi:hypothetical protein
MHNTFAFLLFIAILGLSLAGLCFVNRRVPADYGMLDVLKLPQGQVLFLIACASTAGIIVGVFGAFATMLSFFFTG